jgi:hypothetical protein
LGRIEKQENIDKFYKSNIPGPENPEIPNVSEGLRVNIPKPPLINMPNGEVLYSPTQEEYRSVSGRFNT